jgi:ABC-2 type transport system permease protein
MLVDAAHRTGTLIRHNTILQLRDPAHLISYLVMPMVLMLVFKPVYDRAIPGGSTQVVTGMLVMFSILALAIVGTSVLVERTWHTWDRLRSTAASSIELLVGKAVPSLVVLLLQQTLLILYGIFVIGMPVTGTFWLLPIAVLSWAFALLAIGSAVAAYVRSHGELSAVCDVGALTLSALGGSFVPVVMMPDWIQPFARLSPGYWAVTMMQSAVRGDVSGTLVPVAILTTIGLVAGVLACRRLTRGWGRSSLL